MNPSTHVLEVSAQSQAESRVTFLPDQPLPMCWLISVYFYQVHPPANRIQIFACLLAFFFTSSGKLPISFLIKKYKSKMSTFYVIWGDNSLKEGFTEWIFSFSFSTFHTLFPKLHLLLHPTVSLLLLLVTTTSLFSCPLLYPYSFSYTLVLHTVCKLFFANYWKMSAKLWWKYSQIFTNCSLRMLSHLHLKNPHGIWIWILEGSLRWIR